MVVGRVWIVSADYAFLPEGPTTREIDGIVRGEAIGSHGLSSHSVGSGPAETTLEWRFTELADARGAAAMLEEIAVISNVRVSRWRRERTPTDDEFTISASHARASRAVCAFCGARIAPSFHNLFALEGARAGTTVVLRCDSCGLPMEWLIAEDEDGSR